MWVIVRVCVCVCVCVCVGPNHLFFVSRSVEGGIGDDPLDLRGECLLIDRVCLLCIIGGDRDYLCVCNKG